MPFIMIIDDRATNRSIFSKLSASLASDVQVEAFAGPDGKPDSRSHYY
jgi:hypothetical protein